MFLFPTKLRTSWWENQSWGLDLPAWVLPVLGLWGGFSLGRSPISIPSTPAYPSPAFIQGPRWGLVVARPALPFSQGTYSTRRSHTDVSLNPVTSGCFPHEDKRSESSNGFSKHRAIKKAGSGFGPDLLTLNPILTLLSEKSQDASKRKQTVWEEREGQTWNSSGGSDPDSGTQARETAWMYLLGSYSLLVAHHANDLL